MTPERLARLAEARVAVIGDVMIDEYLTGRIDRISPEAPVPVVQGVVLRATPGGAANVAANVAAIGGSAALVGLAGPGGAAELGALLAPFGRVKNLVCDDKGRRTTRKMRVLSNRQQIVRLDYEDSISPSSEVEIALLEAAENSIAASDIVVLSDYAKGVLSDRVLSKVLAFAKNAGKPVVVDPKRRDFSAYRGADFVTPNRGELALASGMPVGSDAEAEAAARHVQRRFHGGVLLTRSEQGISYFPLHGPPIHVPTKAQEVFDVSGAGDTVVATLAAALGCGFDMAEAILISNHAAGVAVSKAGAVAVSLQELIDSMHLARDYAHQPGALVSLGEARALRTAWARQGLTVGLANGCFDLIHPGHVALLRQASMACDRLIVALNSDLSIGRLKGPQRPAQDQAARAEVMGAMKGVAAVVVFDEDTPKAVVEALRPDLLVKGADYCIEDVVGADVVQAHGGKVLLVKLVQGRSTTRLLSSSK